MSDSLELPPLCATRTGSDLIRAQSLAERGDAAAAAEKFEALLATQLVKELRRGVADGFFGSGAGADVFEGWFDEHIGQALAASDALDLASAVRVSIGHKQAAARQSEVRP